jgi:hypothetical protein
VERRSNSFLWLYPVVLVLSLGVLGWGIYDLAQRNDHPPAVFLIGCVCVIITLLIWSLNLSLHGISRERFAQVQEQLGPVNERLQYVTVLLNQVSEQQLISERAKAIAFRESERDAIRRAIREEMSKKDWEGALKMADEIESNFGYRQEAERLRDDINKQRESEVRKAVNEGMNAIDRHCRTEQWSQALREAERLMKMFPDDPQTIRLPQEIEARRQAHKRQLLDGWNDAVNRHDVDGSIEILKKLDLYLTPQEGLALQETARQVFKDKLLLLGQQFTLAVKDHRWAEAIRLGEQIAAGFPNTRMAQEVRDKMELLHKRASDNVAEPARV